MAENTAISWTDHTINFWIGCQKVSPACSACYAEGMAARFWPGHWGPDAPRLLRVEAATREAMRYQRRAVKEGRRSRVFTNSMSDFFEDRWDLDDARLEALDVIRRTPDLDWLILTKRPEKVIGLLAMAQKRVIVGDPLDRNPALADWLGWWISGKAPANVWMGTTVEDQERADQRIPDLLKVPAAVRFLSCEPLLGPLSMRWTPYAYQATGETYRQYLERNGQINHLEALRKLDWVIAGGESGPNARPSHIGWFRGLRDECAAAGVPFLFKQHGEWAPATGDLWWNPLPDGPQFRTRSGSIGTHAFGDGYGAVRIGKKAAGRLLDGVEHNEFPRSAR